MNTQSIFDSWATFPKIFMVKTAPKTNVNIFNKRFILVPNRLYGVSLIGLLKTRFGIQDGTSYTFKTPFLSINQAITYNEYEMNLILSGEQIIMEIFLKGKQFPACSWDIKNITKAIKKKNPSNNRITKRLVKQLFIEDKLKVRFNVVNNKDHGTSWMIV